MADADSRKQQLLAWRNQRNKKKAAGLASSNTAEASGTNSNSKNSVGKQPTQAPSSSRSSSSAKTSESQTAPRAGSASLVGPKVNTLTPTRLKFGHENEKTAPSNKTAENSAEPATATVTTATKSTAAASIRAKLAASVTKRKRALDERRTRAEALESARKTRKLVEETAASEQVVKKDTQNHLENMVKEQTEIVDSMIKAKKYDEARSFLRQMREEVPMSVKVGCFWMKLAEIEVSLGNRVRAGSIYANALRHCTAPEVLEACSTFIESELFPSMAGAWTLDDLLKNEDLVRPASDEPLDAYLTFNPNTVQKAPRSALRSMNSSRLGSALRSGAKRIPVRFQEDTILENEDPESPEPTRKSRQSLAQSLSKNGATGSIVAVAAVKNKPSQASLLGSETSMTPVRRSARLQKTPSSHADVLRESNFSYTPNPQFDLSALR